MVAPFVFGLFYNRKGTCVEMYIFIVVRIVLHDR